MEVNLLIANRLVMLKDRYYNYIILLFCFLIPISQYLSVRVLLVAFVLSFYGGDKSFNKLKISWDVILYLLMLVIGLFYSEDVVLGTRVLETSFSFFAIPLIFYRIHPLDVQVKNRVFKSFLFGVIISSVICLLYAIYRYSYDPNIKYFVFETLTEAIKSHPTYLAYYIIFSITIELYFLYHSKHQSKLLLHYIIVFFLFIILILTGGQTAFISMLFVFSFFILKFLTEEMSRDRKLVVGSIIVMLVSMFLVSLVERNNRSLELNDSWERAALWKSAILANSNFLIGVGTGDYKVALNDYYLTHNMISFASESYNAHNQFIQILFSNGILGLISVIIMIGRPIYFGIKTNNILPILCMFPFLIYGITEVFLGRFQGVVFFALLHQIFLTEMNSQNVVGRDLKKNRII
jgi:O-antigen ligase